MKPRSTIALIREAASRREAIRQYAEAHNALSELEQHLAGEGRPVEAEGAHSYALIALRAYRAELDDPEPKA